MTISAVLLAGGKSRRMGEDKAAILFRNAPLWQIQLDLLRRLELEELFISAQTDPPWRPAEIQFVPDDQPSRGPLSGIAAALSRISTGHLLALAIDMPFMPESYLRRLCEKVECGRGVVPLIENQAEPLSAPFPAVISRSNRSSESWSRLENCSRFRSLRKKRRSFEISTNRPISDL
jgi:molybdopterin-guanine dinucleotide biosynthesis protein A